MSSFEQQFNDLPENLKKMVYSKIVYTQPKEFLNEIKNRYIYSEVIKLVTTKKMKLNLENMINTLVDSQSKS